MTGSSAPPTATTPAGQVARPRRRTPFWDNARFACIVLVVLGHAVQRLIYDSDIALSLYLVVYAFHMPAFAIISGYFSKSDAPTRTQMARVITDILVPYIVFEGLWTLTKWLVEGQANPNLTEPSWTLWFLLALGIFRVVLPYLALLRWPLRVDGRDLDRRRLPAQHRLDVLAVADARPAPVLHARLVAARARHRRAPAVCSTGARGGCSPVASGCSRSPGGRPGSSSTSGAR